MENSLDLICPELQIRRDIEDNSKIIILSSD